MNEPRANLYQALAEAVAEPPGWLALQGCDWPLYDAALQLTPVSEAARQAVVAMMEIGEESIEQRQDRYAALFAAPGRPLIWIYESGALHGRLFDENTLEVEQWYRALGLNIVGEELPDHASIELAFLAYLSGAEQEEFSRIENDFLNRHAMRWLPALGCALASSGDNVYTPIGRLLADWLEEINPRLRSRLPQKNRLSPRQVPVIHTYQVEDCILCGFCTQTCPVRALVMSENQQVTRLNLSARLCVGCGKCVRVCEPHVLVMEEIPMSQERATGWETLRQSPRSTCKACGRPMVSQAELNYVSARLGDPTWLELCEDCRPGFL